MKEKIKIRLKEDWLIIFIASFVSIVANYGFLNYLNTGIAFSIGEIDFWEKIVFPLCVIILITMGIAYGIIFLIDRILSKR